MALFSIPHVALRGVAACVPENKARTADYALFSEQERDLFIKSVGISERRVAPAGVATSDLCFASAEALLQKLNWEKDSIDCLIFVSQSPDYFLPATSILLQHRLGLNTRTMAFDINLGCSGYIYGLQIMANLISTAQIKRGLLLVGDKSTLSTHDEDKSTYPLFGDAGSATALEHDPGAAPLYFNLQSDGGGENAIKILDGGARNSVRPDTFDIQEIEPGVKRSRRHLILNGIDVFNFALREVVPNISELLQYAGTEKESVDYFIFHQANRLINESVRKKLKVTDAARVPYSIDHFGNTSSASIPLTMVTRLKDQLEGHSSTLVLSGFGVGFSWGTCILTADHPVCCDLIEL